MTPRDRRPDNEQGPVNWGIMPKRTPRPKSASARPGGNGLLEVVRSGNNPAPTGSSASAASSASGVSAASAAGSADGSAGAHDAGGAAVMTEEDLRSAAAQARQLSESSKKGGSGKGAKGSPSSQRGPGADGARLPGTDLATLTVPGTKVLVPESTGRRELTTLDVVSGPVTTALAATSFGRAADERLAGTSTGETLIRVGQLLLGATGFVLVALGLASILGQVIS